VLFAFVVACESVDGRARAVLAIEHVNVVPMDSERVLADQTVLVRGERIDAIGRDRGRAGRTRRASTGAASG
jgi:hypothetical protein